MQKIESDSISIIILGLAGAFVFASLNESGMFLEEALWFFLYAMIVAYVKQIWFSDKLSFARHYEDLPKGKVLKDYHKELWRKYYVFLLVISLVFAAIIVYSSSFFNLPFELQKLFC